MILTALVLAGCGGKTTPTPTVTPTIIPTTTPSPSATPDPASTPLPTATPTLEPLGTSGNPIIIGLVGPRGGVPAPGSTTLADSLSTQTNLVIRTAYFPDYTALLAAVASQKVHVTALPPLTYLLAHQEGWADVILVANHFGSYGYGTQFMVHADSGFASYYDTATNLNTADALTALQQFSGKRPCWVEPQSLSGYILPWGILTEQGISLQPGATLQTNTGVVRALYIQGICDFGATYSTSGDPRTSSAVLDDLDDVLSKVFIVWRSDAIIPNTNISVIPTFPAIYKKSLVEALMTLAKDEASKTLISQTLDYEVEDFKKVDDTYYEPLRYFVALAELDLNQMLGK